MAKRRFRPEDALRLRTANDPDLSPDGRRVAFAIAEPDEASDRLCSSIWMVPVDASEPPRRFTEGPPDRSPRFSPDGRWLAYISVQRDEPDEAHVRLASRLDGVGWQDGRRHLFLLEVEGGATRQLTRGEYDHDDPVFSPDGATIAFASDRHPAGTIASSAAISGSYRCPGAGLGV